MKKALIFGFLATSLTMLAVAPSAQAEMNDFRVPQAHECTPEEIDFTIQNISVIKQDCSPASLAVMKRLAAHVGTCKLGNVPLAWIGKITKGGGAYLKYAGLCKAQQIQSDIAARQAAARQEQEQQQFQQQALEQDDQQQ